MGIIIYTEGIICLKKDTFKQAISYLNRYSTRIVQAIRVKLHVDMSIYQDFND